MSKINSKVREYILSLDDNKDFPDEEIAEYIQDQDVIYEGSYSEHRWWTSCFRVCKIGDMFIGYNGARGGDIHDRGWEFDPSSICEVEPYEEHVVKYKKVK